MTMYGNTTVSSSLQGSRGGGTIHLRSLNKSHASRQDSDTGESRFRLRPEEIAYRVDVRGATSDGDGGRGGSGDSDRMIIHQETSYRVESSTV